MKLARKLQLKRRMATTLSVQDYLTYFLLKNDGSESKSDSKEKNQGQMLVATVYKKEEDGDEIIIYSRRMAGGKSADPMALVVQELTGNTDSHVNGGNLIRTSSLMNLHNDIGTQIPNNSSVSIDILSSRSPSKVGSEEIQRLLEYCKRNSIKASVQLTFAHAFSWDNKYNKEGLQRLHEKGVKLRPLSFQQGLNMMVNDMLDTLETLDELQTCRGTICINYYMLRRAISKFRDALLVQSDLHYEENENKLREILGYQNGVTAYQNEHQHKLKSFSLATYRDYFFLQNTEEIWAKLQVAVTKLQNGIVQEETLFSDIYNSPEQTQERRSMKNSNSEKNPLRKEKLSELIEKLWKMIGENVTLKELASQDEIAIRVTSTISEYPDRLGWHQAFHTLHTNLAEKIFATGMKKVRIESTIRYAMNIASSSDGTASGRSTPSTSSGNSSKVEADRDLSRVATECMHIQDILFEMLEDLEDNLLQLGSINYDRGAKLHVDKSILSSAMGILNKATNIRTEEGKLFSMNSDFPDQYSESVNST